MRHLRFVVLGLTVAAALGMSTLGCSCKSSQVELDRNLFWSPSTLDFGQVAIGDSGWQTLTLTHVGLSGTIDFSKIRLENLNTDEFTFDMPEKVALEPGESTVITVYYAPIDSDTDDGHLVIEHNVAQQGNITRVPVTALGKVAELIAIPNPIDFGQVHVGEFKDIDVVLRNVGSDIVDITQIYLRMDGSTDFTIEGFSHSNGSALPATLNPRGEMGVVVRYEPIDGLCDETTLVVMGETKGETQAWSFDVTGCELGPKIVVVPGEINFDWVEIDKTEEKLVAIENAGNADLVIPADGIAVFPGSPDIDNIALVDLPTDETRIAPDGTPLEFKVQWTAAEPRPDDGNPVGYVSIASNDAAHSPTMIPVFGKVDAPILTVIPEAMDMGYGAQQVAVQRTLTLSNEGHGTLKVFTMEITEVSETQYGTEFAIKADPAFPVTSGGGESTIAGNTPQPVVLTFKNLGPDKGDVTAKLVITTNVRGMEHVEIPIVAHRSGSPVCNIGIGPAGLNYATVAIGFPEQRYMNLANTGTGVCIFKDLKIVDCSSGMFGGATCGAPLAGTKSNIFTITGVPPVGTQIQPGEVFTMNVVFNPPKSTGLFAGLLTTHYALLGVKAQDALLGNEVVIPKCGANPCQPNLTGSAGIAKVSVLPAEIDYGVNTIGCCSQTFNVCVYNSGNAPLKINDIQLKGCTPEFRVVNVPKLPRSVLAGATPVCIQTVYRPQDLGSDQCTMHIAVTDVESPTVTIPLRGEGTYETEQIDEFKQVSGQEVDILYVIDDSGSMCEEQTRLSQSFSQFIQHASVWNNDYHIGVISVNVVDEPVMGKLNRGDAKITPKFITPTNGGSFSKLSYLGCDGGSDAQEAAVQAAQSALSAPLTTDTGISCSSDTTCKNDPNICPDPAACAYTCVDGTCGGWNRGFLRTDAQLEIVALSDEEDQSSAAIAFYVDFLKNLKGWYNVNMMHFNAIVGVKGVPAGGSEGDCVASDGGTAAAGKRYIEVANQTGGKVGSICESSFAPIMNEIGEITFVPKVQFFLSRLADPASIELKVNGTKCTSGWRYDAPSNSIIFELDGACMPEAEDDIWVKYQTLCLKC